MKPALELSAGEHICALYRSICEATDILVPLIVTTLENGHKCVGIIDRDKRDALLEALLPVDPSLPDRLSSGQFELLTPEETYVKDDSFSPEKMLDMVRMFPRRAGESGYPSIRFFGEMSWAFRNLPGVERFIEYESMLNQLMDNYPGEIICLYDITQLAGEKVFYLLQTHPRLLVNGMLLRNPYYVAPEEFLLKWKVVASN